MLISSIILVLISSITAIAIFTRRFQNSIQAAPRLYVPKIFPTASPFISVIIPAYNEEINIRNCVEAVWRSELPDPQQLEILIADDESSDRTRIIASELAVSDQRVKVINVPPRPTTEIWVGKNWACSQAVKQASGEYLLFIDADVRLEPQAISAALAEAQNYQTGLLSCAPEIVCGCFSEWLVQPLIMTLLTVGFNFEQVNDPNDLSTAFAAGPFMLFSRSAYEHIGGHAAVASEIVEDVELGKLIKNHHLNLRYILGLGLIKVRMYQSFAALWEGWTKNWYMGSGRNLGMVLYSNFVVILVFVVPWLGLASYLFGQLSAILSSESEELTHQLISFGRFGITKTGLELLTLGLSLIAIALQYRLRLITAKNFAQPLRYWWLGWLSGLLVVAIAMTSIIKTKTGWQWTWRGRSLSVK